MLALVFPPPALGQSALDTIREDVRNPPAEPPQKPHRDKEREDKRWCERCNHYHGGYDCRKCPDCPSSSPITIDSPFLTACLYYTAAAATSPFWGPHVLFRDDLSALAYYPRHPYDGTSGYLISEWWQPRVPAAPEQLGAKDLAAAPPHEVCVMPEGWQHCRNWSLQLRGEYQDQFDRVSAVGGQMILEGTSRLGFDISFQTLRERLGPEQFDYLTLGDANVVFRFAQHPKAQMRLGIGMNWLADTRQHDLGFNFTYGGDFFPVKPLIVSAAIDWGTLGHAELFRFRTTAGVIVDRFETYVGYEYLDIGRTHANALVAGVRLWF
jgi:hypothetical protein